MIIIKLNRCGYQGGEKHFSFRNVDATHRMHECDRQDRRSNAYMPIYRECMQCVVRKKTVV